MMVTQIDSPDRLYLQYADQDSSSSNADYIRNLLQQLEVLCSKLPEDAPKYEKLDTVKPG